MPLVPMRRLLRHAREHRYAVGYFESWNLESILAVKDAAEQEDSPVILGFNGGFLGNQRRRVPENIRHYGALGKAIAEQAQGFTDQGDRAVERLQQGEMVVDD